jgi:multisubunit Na+/H+ antiporter MnhB subunit
MSKIVRTVARFLTPAVLLYGLYVIMHGHISSGGGFQGGAVFASAVALLIVAFGADRVEQHLKEHRLSALASGGAVMFIGLAFAGLGTAFFYNLLVGSSLFGHVPAFGPSPEDIWTGGTIPLMNVAVSMNVIAGLSAIMLVMALAASKCDGDK